MESLIPKMTPEDMPGLFLATPKDWDSPVWDSAQKVHEWKNYIYADVRALWGTFTPEQKQAIARQAEEMADQEDWE